MIARSFPNFLIKLQVGLRLAKVEKKPDTLSAQKKLFSGKLIEIKLDVSIKNNILMPSYAPLAQLGRAADS